MVKRMRKNEKLRISTVKDCSVARFRGNLLPLALELLSSLPSSPSFVFSSLFYSFRVQKMEFRAFGAFSDFFEAVWPKLAERSHGATSLAPRRCDFWASWLILGTWACCSAAALHFGRRGAALWRCGAAY